MNRFQRPSRSALLASLLPAGLFFFALYGSPNVESPGRIIAIGDIHGALDAFREILEVSGLIGPEGWTGSHSVLVQTGDFLDRGPQGRQVMDLLMALQKEAPRRGGRVVVLLGNHEVMNLIHDLRYVSLGAYASFAEPGSEKRLEHAWEEFAQYRLRRARRHQDPEFSLPDVSKSAWMQAHPAGFLERQAALSTGKYGKWLRSLAAVEKVGDSLFVHGGLHTSLQDLSVKELNQRVSSELRKFKRLWDNLVKQDVILPFFTLSEATEAVNQELYWAKANLSELEAQGKQDARLSDRVELLVDFNKTAGWFIRHPDGPFWFRGYAKWEDVEAERLLPGLLNAFKVDHIVVGHTTMLNEGIVSRSAGKVFLIDTGMLATYYEGGTASALEIAGGTVSAIYPDSTEVLYPPEVIVSN